MYTQRMSYYIKTVWPGRGQRIQTHPDGTEKIEFSDVKTRCEAFADCEGFLLYETGRPGAGNYIGQKTIFAQGKPADHICKQEFLIIDDKKFPYFVNVHITESVEPIYGVSLQAIYAISDICKKTRMQQRGGLIQISKEEFEALSAQLMANKKLVY